MVIAWRPRALGGSGLRPGVAPLGGPRKPHQVCRVTAEPGNPRSGSNASVGGERAFAPSRASPVYTHVPVRPPSGSGLRAEMPQGLPWEVARWLFHGLERGDYGLTKN